MTASYFPPEAEESWHDATPSRARRARFSLFRGCSLIAAFSLTLTACSGEVSTRSSSDLGPRTLSGFVGSPSLADATVTLLVDSGNTVISARSDDQARPKIRRAFSARMLRLSASGSEEASICGSR